MSPRRWLIFLLVLPLLALCAGFTRLATEKITYRIVIDGEQEMVSLRRLGSHALRYRHYRLGHLRRGLDGHHRFTANAEDVAVKIEVEAQAGHYVARIRDLGAILFSAEPLRGSSPGGAAESSSPRRPGESMIARPGQASSASKIPTVQTHQPSQGIGGAPPPRRPGPADRNFERQ